MPVWAQVPPAASAFPLSANAATIVRTSATRNFVPRAHVYEDFDFIAPLPRAAVARMKRAAPGRVSPRPRPARLRMLERLSSSRTGRGEPTRLPLPTKPSRLYCFLSLTFRPVPPTPLATARGVAGEPDGQQSVVRPARPHIGRAAYSAFKFRERPVMQ